VLVVEDDAGVRSALTRMLVGHGYRVLQATDGVEAAALLEGDEMRIDLLLTDVVMPRSSGPEIAALVRQRCGSKVLFMSGYNEHSALSSGGIERGQGFIQKPFSPQSLAKKVREVLDV
jgi:two-component system cell cycle sensor histidine kinase/response regulator CckA